MKSRLIAIVSMLALVACEPPREESRFTSAVLAPDGNMGLFVFKRERYYPETMGLLTSGRPRKYLVNQSVIGTYDLATGQTRVLQRRDHGNKYVHEREDFQLMEVQGSRALLWGGDGNYHWLDIGSGELTTVPLKEELEARGRAVGRIHLVDESGTLVFENKSLPQSFDTSVPEEMWLRRPSGEYERVSEVPPGFAGYYGFKDNEVHFYSAARRAYLIYNLDRRDFRKGDPRQIPSMRRYDAVVDFQVGDHGSPQPKIGRKVDGKWEYREVQIDTKELR
ncbi:MAG TPA: hypothetical protein VF297_04320 [Pyrinomonadaceae bacterium]